MGTYYIAVNHTRKEYIEPGEIGGFGVKFAPMVLGPIGHLIVWKLILSEWDDVGLVPDHGELFYTICETYRNITEETVAAYNEYAAGADNPSEYTIPYKKRE